MWFSRINPSFTFNEHMWLVTAASFSDSEEKLNASSATLIIEGKLSHQLLFARYDIQARACASKPGYFLERIRCFEAARYKLPHHQPMTALTYPAPPKACDSLHQYLQYLAQYLFRQQKSIRKNPLQPIYIPKTCIQWCFELLWEYDISRESHAANKIHPWELND